MTKNEMTIKEKKLKIIRKILWICFSAFLACVLLFAMPFSVLVSRGEVIDTAGGMNIPVWPFFIISQVLGIAFIGGICLIIYNIFKYRINKKEDDLFM